LIHSTVEFGDGKGLEDAGGHAGLVLDPQHGEFGFILVVGDA
jgi:hypothetical protein